MKRIFLCMLVFIPALLTAQQNGQLKDGYQQFRYPNGNISSEGYIETESLTATGKAIM